MVFPFFRLQLAAGALSTIMFEPEDLHFLSRSFPDSAGFSAGALTSGNS